MNNNELYERLMSLRKAEPKRYYFLRLQEKYDQIVTAFNKKNKDLVCERVKELNDFIKGKSSMYGITAPEVKRYFVNNNLTMNFKF